MTYDEFMQLGAGDILVLRGPNLFKRERLTHRTIISGPRDDKRTKPAAAIQFPIRNRSWTGRITTTYFWNDLKHRIVQVIKREGACQISPEEAERHHRMGFKKKDFFREIKDGRRSFPEFKEQMKSTWYKCAKPYYN